MKAIATLGLAPLLGAGAVYYFGSSETYAEPAAVEPSSQPKEGEAALADSMQAVVETPEAKQALPRKERLYFPDGSYLPALNGATNAPPVEFRGRAYSPVIGRTKDSSGREWYKHEDGSQSTTFMGWRKDLGRMDAITQVAHPTEPRPLLKDEVVGPGGISPPAQAGGGAGGAATKGSSAGAPPKR